MAVSPQMFGTRADTPTRASVVGSAFLLAVTTWGFLLLTFWLVISTAPTAASVDPLVDPLGDLVALVTVVAFSVGFGVLSLFARLLACGEFRRRLRASGLAWLVAVVAMLGAYVAPRLAAATAVVAAITAMALLFHVFIAVLFRELRDGGRVRSREAG